MKKSLIFLLVYWLTLAQKADAQSRKFYYYPENNVYYDINGKQYFYNRHGKWSPAAVLPLTIKLNITDRVILYNNSGHIWEHNALHVKKYPRGRAVGYKGTNPKKTNVAIAKPAQAKVKPKPARKP